MRVLVRPRLRSVLLGAVLLGACSLHASAARATGPEDAEAEALIARGVELRERGKDDEALAVFKKALARSSSPRARAQVALAEQALGLWVAAEADLQLALAAEGDPWIAKNRAALDGALGVVRRHLGSLEIRGTDGADVFLDGVKLGTLPATAPFRVEAGKRTLELRAKGHQGTTRAVEVPAGGIGRETVMLVALPASETPAPSGPTGGPRGSEADRDPGRSQRLIGWAFAGAGGALLITGAVGFIVRKGIVDDYNNACPGLGVGQPADCDSRIESARTWLTVSIISLVAGGVFGVGGITLVATAPRRDSAASLASPPLHGSDLAPARQSRAVDVGCAPSMLPSGGALSCTGSF